MKTPRLVSRRSCSRGFTTIELVVVIGIATVLVVVGIGIYDSVAKKKVKGGWTVAPATITPSGGQFTYTVQVKKSGQWQPHPGRALSFRAEPAAHITLTPATGNTAPGGDYVLTVTPAVDYCYGVNLWAKDVKSGEEDPPVYFTVVCPP